MKFSISGGSMNERSFVVFDNARAFCLLFLFCCRVYNIIVPQKKTTIRSRTFPFVIDDPTHSTRHTCFYRPPFIVSSQIENLGVKLQKSNQLINLNTYCTYLLRPLLSRQSLFSQNTLDRQILNKL